MIISKTDDLKLKVGNLMLAAIFAIVPTSMTIAFLTVHGHLLCRSLDTRLESVEGQKINPICIQSNYEVNYSYIIWIWMFTTIPTWRWFYIGHYKRVTNNPNIFPE